MRFTFELEIFSGVQMALAVTGCNEAECGFMEFPFKLSALQRTFFITKFRSQSFKFDVTKCEEVAIPFL